MIKEESKFEDETISDAWELWISDSSIIEDLVSKKLLWLAVNLGKYVTVETDSLTIEEKIETFSINGVLVLVSDSVLVKVIESTIM